MMVKDTIPITNRRVVYTIRGEEYHGTLTAVIIREKFAQAEITDNSGHSVNIVDLRSVEYEQVPQQEVDH